jgi:hypothetical protein
MGNDPPLSNDLLNDISSNPMGNSVVVGIEDFSEISQNCAIYVDKTEFVHQLLAAGHLGTF